MKQKWSTWRYLRINCMAIFHQNLIAPLLLTISLLFPLQALYASVTVSPLLVDVTAEARDNFTRTITLSNADGNNLRLYASVHEIEVGEGEEIQAFVPASMSDRAASITSWIEITRGRIELASGESKEIPLTIRVNQNAASGLYHAYIGFASGTNRDDAEAKILSGQASGVVLRILVGGKQEEFLKLTSFTTDRISYTDTKGTIRYTLENTGDVPLTPKGDVIIYDSRGKELTVVSLNADGKSVIQPGEKILYTENLPFINRIGKNKAFLSLEYGIENRAALYDTNFYYSIPIYFLILIVVLLAIVLTGTILMLRRGGRVELVESHEAHDLPLFVRTNKDHSEYEHDIDLTKKVE